MAQVRQGVDALDRAAGHPARRAPALHGRRRPDQARARRRPRRRPHRGRGGQGEGPGPRGRPLRGDRRAGLAPADRALHRLRIRGVGTGRARRPRPAPAPGRPSIATTASVSAGPHRRQAGGPSASPCADVAQRVGADAARRALDGVDDVAPVGVAACSAHAHAAPAARNSASTSTTTGVAGGEVFQIGEIHRCRRHFQPSLKSLATPCQRRVFAYFPRPRRRPPRFGAGTGV